MKSVIVGFVVGALVFNAAFLSLAQKINENSVLPEAAFALGGESLQNTPPRVSDTDRLGIEQVSDFARAELAFWQTVYGAFLGWQICFYLECNDVRLDTGSVLLGGVTGLSISLLATPDGITAGHSGLINSATGWGLWNAIALNSYLNNWNGKAWVGTVIAGKVAGVGSGIALWDSLRPQAGDVSLVNSSGIWSGVLTLLTVLALELRLDFDDTMGTLLVTSDLGGLAGGYLTSIYPMSWGRVLLINSSGLLGLLLGFGIPAVILGSDVGIPLRYGSAIVGTLAGLGLGTYFSRDWLLKPDQEAPSPAAWSTTVPVVSWAF